MAEATTAKPVQAPTAPAAEVKPPAETVVATPPAPAEDTLKPRFDALEKQAKRHAQEQRKLAQEREAFAKERQEHEAWKLRQADKNRNPAKYIAAEYGEDWYDKLTELRVNGTPPAVLIASELEAQEQRMRGELKTETEKLRDELRKRDEQENVRAKEEYEAQAVNHAKGNPDKYPLLHLFGEF